MEEGEQVQGTQYAVGQRVKVIMPDSVYYGQEGSVKDIYARKVNGEEVTMYSVRLNAGRDVQCRFWAIKAAQEAAGNE